MAPHRRRAAIWRAAQKRYRRIVEERHKRQARLSSVGGREAHPLSWQADDEVIRYDRDDPQP